jgi:hypothetical protein
MDVIPAYSVTVPPGDWQKRLLSEMQPGDSIWWEGVEDTIVSMELQPCGKWLVSLQNGGGEHFFVDELFAVP